MSLENIFAAKAATVPEATSYLPPLAPCEVTATPLPITIAQQTIQATLPPSIPESSSTQQTTPVGVTLTSEQWASYSNTQARIAELEGAEQRRRAEAQTAEVKALQAKGQIEQAFNLQREQARLELESERKKLQQTEERAKRYALDGELARSLAAQPLVAGGAEQLTQLWRSQFTVEPQGDSFAVQAPGFQPVGQWIAAQLGRPEYSHFLRAQNPGGGTQGGPPGTQGLPTAPGQAAAPPVPQNMSEAILMQMAAMQKSTADPRLSGATQADADGKVIRQQAAAFGLRPYPPKTA
jgi:hypothetical protein